MKRNKHLPSSSPYKGFFQFLPFLLWWPSLTRDTLRADLLAGLTGAIIVLPQGIAYALIAGLPPEYGLYTAIVTPIIAGLFGSSMHLVSGPTAAISIVVFSVVSGVTDVGSSDFITVVLTITFLVGVIQLIFGLVRLGFLINFISHTVVLGFTSGAAVLIATSQLKYITNIELAGDHSFAGTWTAFWVQFQELNLLALITSLVTIVIALLSKKFAPKLPNMLIGMIAGGVFCWFLNGHQQGIALIGALAGNLPSFSVEKISPQLISTLLPGAFAIALLALVEAVSIAKAIAIRSGQRIDGNQEFVGQGLSNIVGSFFSCYAGSGSFTRSGANYDSGARTPLAALLAAGFVALILTLMPKATTYLPLPVMGGIILLIAWNLIDIAHIVQIFKSSKQESIIFSTTFISTVFIELEFAIYTGVLLSLLLYLRRTSKPTLMEVAPKSLSRSTDLRSISRFNLNECPQLKIVRIDGSIFFGATDHIQKKLRAISEKNQYKYLLLYCPGINFIDIAGGELLLQESRRLQRLGGALYFCGLKNTVKDELEKIGYLQKLKSEIFYPLPDDALEHIVLELNRDICGQCPKHVFKQCPDRP